MAIRSLKLDNIMPANASRGGAKVTDTNTKDIAIIGMAVDYPKAKTPEAFWAHLRNGADLIGPIPDSRRNDVLELMEQGGQASEETKFRTMAYLEDIAGFDPGFFNLSPKEASLMDPNQRKFLECCRLAIEDAGYGGRRLRGSKTGVWVGFGKTPYDYDQLVAKTDPEWFSMAYPGNIAAMIPSRISYMLDLKGPTMVVDTACSSSLVAVHLAVRSLRSGECDAALVGGVKICLFPVEGGVALGVESGDNRTWTFDDSADGTGGGEGVAVVMLKPLAKAKRDRDHIYAVIKGSAVNQDGESIGITAPNAPAQAAVLERAWQDAGIDPKTLGHIEAHGTGTPLGDPIEIDGMRRAFSKYTPQRGFCAVGSVKTNMGHLDSTAGITGLVKSVMMLRHKQLPPSLNFRRPNRKIPFEDAPVYVNDRLRDWQSEGPRRCGVSSFGISGTNCHVVLEEAPGDQRAKSQDPIRLLTVSARTRGALRAQVSAYRDFVVDETCLDLDDFCFTINTGRGGFAHRTGFVFRDRDELLANMENWLCAEAENDFGEAAPYRQVDAGHGDADPEALKDHNETLRKALAAFKQGGKTDVAGARILLDSFLTGADVDWEPLYRGDGRRRVPAPGSAFEKMRCWISPDDLQEDDGSMVDKEQMRELALRVAKAALAQGGTDEAALHALIDAEMEALQAERRGRKHREVEVALQADRDLSEFEALVGRIWGEVLGLKSLHVDDNFFDLGGDSVIAMKIANALSRELNDKLQIVSVLRNPTPAMLAAHIRAERVVAGLPYERLIAVTEGDIFPLSSAQKRLYLIDQMGAAGSGYNMPMVLEVNGDLHLDRFRDAWRQLVARHETLRTSFHMIEGQPRQQIHAHVELLVEEIEIDEAQARETAAAFIQPFDLSQAPLMRVVLLKTAPQKRLLLFDMHHIISDGFSMGLLVRELVAGYAGETLPALEVQYKDFAVWQNQIREEGAYAESETYWTEQFAQEPPVLELPTDFPRPAIRRFEGESLGFAWSAETTKAVEALARETGASLFQVLLALYNVLLHKYSGAADIVVGSPIAGRPHGALEQMVGMFVNSLALRNRPRADLSFRDFLAEVRENTLSAFEHEDFLFEDLVERLNLRRDLARSPLFDTMFGLQNFGMPDLVMEGVSFAPYPFENKVSKFDLTVTAYETDAGLTFNAEYDTALFKGETIQRMMSHFERLAELVCENLDGLIGSLDPLSDEERRFQLETFNQTETAYPRDASLAELFEAVVAGTPGAEAFRYAGRSYSYQQLNQDANRIAHKLISKGVQPGTVVGLLFERGYHMLSAIVGVLKSGGAYLPMDPSHPQDRLAYMIADSGAEIILAQSGLQTPAGLERIDLDHADLSGFSDQNPTRVACGQDLVYLIYTSGSTGQPKGTRIHHHNVSRVVRDTNYIQIRPEDRVMQLSNYAFDGSVFDIYAALLNGACLCMPETERLLDVRLLADYIAEEGISISFMTTALFNTLVDTRLDALQGLRKLLFGGERVSVNHTSRALKAMGPGKILHVYGPTESTVYATFHPVDQLDPRQATVPIGKPLANTRAYVLDPQNRLLPFGVAGELCLAGDGLSSGYLNRPELTAEKFQADPFMPGERMYRTGDLVRLYPDQGIEFLDRIDQQVKIRGFRIELGEIEARLAELDGVREAVVVAIKDRTGNMSLCAYLTAEQRLALSEVRTILGRNLPDFMLPDQVVYLDKMPLNANGKVDKKALPEPDQAGALQADFIAPTTDTELRLAKIWAGLLGLDQVGANGHFFELGGHSLRAAVLAAEVRKVFTVDLPLAVVFAKPVLSELAAYIDAAENSTHFVIEAAETADNYPLSPAQQRVFLLERFDQVGTAYNMPTVLELNGDLDRDRLHAAFEALMERHESLRTSFHLEDGDPVQRVHEKPCFEMTFEALAEPQVGERIKAFIRPFDLGQAPLFRVGLIRLQENRHLLCFDMHHIISDGTSIGNLVRDLAALYRGDQPPSLALQYRDYAVWTRSDEGRRVFAEQAEYWQQTFGESVPVLDLPLDQARPLWQRFDGGYVGHVFDRELSDQLKSLARREGVSLHMLLLAAYGVLLHHYAGQDDMAVGMPVGGRRVSELQPLIGMFVNTLAVRMKPSGDKCFTAFLAEVKNSCTGAYDHQDYPFEKLVEDLNLPRDTSRNPLFDTMFVLQNLDLPNLELPGLRLGAYPFENNVSKFDMTWNAYEGDNLSFNVEYATAVLKESTVARMLSRFEAVCRQLVAEPETTIGNITLIQTEERQAVVYDLNQTEIAYRRDETILQAFARVVEKHPERTALAFDERGLTYAELDRRGNQIAHHLCSLGAGQGRIVAVLHDRPLDTVTAILAVLKSGAAYLPVDANLPAGRISFMLEQAEAAVIISRRDLLPDLEYRPEIVLTDEDQECFDRQVDSEPVIAAPSAMDPAYVIYTSGSTGQPKGAIIPHRGVLNLVAGLEREVYSRHGDGLRVAQLAAFNFDASVQQIFASLLLGHTLYPVPASMKRDPDLLISYLASNRIDVVDGTPSLWDLLVADAVSDRRGWAPRHIIIGGEALPVNLLQRYFEGSEGKETLWTNVYGLTEASVDSTAMTVSFEDLQTWPQTQVFVPIGRPLANTRLYLLDDLGRPVAPGLRGEICVAGDGLALGYLKRDDLTAARFVDDPFFPGQRLYRTGDLGRLLADGTVQFLGRSDFQVKISGYRIELGEIEHQIRALDGVEEAVAVVLPIAGTATICAYIRGNGALDNAALRTELSQQLPDYMVPGRWMQLDEMPLNSSGKIDRSKLPIPELLAVSADFVAARNEVEKTVVALWCEVLGTSRVGVRDNFFDIGGNSLLLIKLHAKLSEAFPGRVSVTDMFAHPTPEGLASFIKGEDAGDVFEPTLLPLPADAFGQGHESHFLTLNLEASQTRAVHRAAETEQVAVDDVLAAVFLYLQSELSGVAQPAVQLGIDGERAVEVVVDLASLEDFGDLFRTMAEARAGEGYRPERLQAGLTRAEEGLCLPIFSRELPESWRHAYDLQVTWQTHGESIELAFEAVARLAREHIALNARGFSALLDAVLEAYQ